MNRRVLVTGGAGEMGIRLVKRLVEGGWQVRALVLPADPLRGRLDNLLGTLKGFPDPPATDSARQAELRPSGGCEIVEGDVRDAASLGPAVAGVDTVFHLAAVILAKDPQLYDTVNRRGTGNLVAAAAAAGVRHFVYVSSASVVYPRLTPYGRSKLDAEELVRREARFQHTIVRPTLVYDGTGGQEFMLFLDYLRRFPVVPFIGPGTAKKSPVFSDDVVDGLYRIAGNAVAHGKTYNLSGGESITLEELGRLLLAKHGQPKRFLHLPVRLCQAVAAVLEHTMKDPPLTPYAVAGFTNHADLDCSAAVRELGYHPRGVREGIDRCFDRRPQ